MGKDYILTVAGIEAMLNVSWRTHKWRVQEYIRTSTAGGWAPHDPRRSWCGDFAFWVLAQAGVSKLPPLAQLVKVKDSKGKETSMWNTIRRYLETYPSFKPGAGEPQPGDMYYMPKTSHSATNYTHHVGFVKEPGDGSTFKSVDGNTGGNLALMVPGLGGGFVGYNTRSLSLVDCFIRIPD